ncbi:MAG TPA: hypothetical protein VH277_10635 [Gemmatimonadaceae bacterium]|jgi:hypothetical protein|nr:hypothetical protein [Gemmatimonadaceae bacterium]
MLRNRAAADRPKAIRDVTGLDRVIRRCNRPDRDQIGPHLGRIAPDARLNPPFVASCLAKDAFSDLLERHRLVT